MRISLFDFLIAGLLFLVGFFVFGFPLTFVVRIVMGVLHANPDEQTAKDVFELTCAFSGFGFYWMGACPVYRRLRLLPMLHPCCPCCKEHRGGFWYDAVWPRLHLRCPECNGEFVLWLNGKPDEGETWERPVVALHWPYVFGRYERVEKSKPAD